jgi:hypothetical protein
VRLLFAYLLSSVKQKKTIMKNFTNRVLNDELTIKDAVISFFAMMTTSVLVIQLVETGLRS